MVTCILLAPLLMILFATNCTPVDAQDTPYIAVGQHKVLVVNTVKLQDKKRDKNIEALVRYPDGAGPFPIVVFSHGSFANKEAFAPASEHWASHGYVVIHPNHADARGEAGGGELGAPRAIGGLNGALGSGGRIERIKDITTILDTLDQVETGIPALCGKLDVNRIAVAGHSFGAYVAQCHGGVKTLVDGMLQDLSDSRVKCVVAISAQGESQSYGLTTDSWSDARKPALHITGTRDRSAPDRPGGPFGDVNTKKIPFERSPAGGKYLLIIEGATHVSFGGKLGRLRGGVDAAGLTKYLSLAFLEAFLKQNAHAKAWLDGEESTNWLGRQATLQRKL